MATLNELNALRTAVGMKPLKAWKESKVKLEAAIAKLQANTTTTQQLEATKVIVDSLTDKAEEIYQEVIKEKKNVGVSISEIAKSLGINDKVARAKLRRRDDVPCLPGKAWTFAHKDVAKVKEILKQDNRKKRGE